MHLGACCANTRQNGEYRFLAFLYFLVKNIISLVQLHKSWSAEDYHYGIDVLELLLAEIDGNAQLLGRSCGKDVDRVGNRRAREQFFFQFVGSLPRERRNIHSALREGVGKHHARSSRMCDDSEVLARESRQGEDTAHSCQFVTREAAHDACLAEQRLHSRVARCDGTRMT